MTQERFIRKTIPQASNESRLSENGNNSHPQVETRTFSLDSFRDGKRLPGSKIEVATPLLPFRLTFVAGHRTIGGGTSKEALRRAKKKTA